jgi:hypothetical protein
MNTRLASLSLLALAAASVSGCVVAPARYAGPAYVEPVYAAPPGVVYVAPTYAVPAPGYVWAYHARFGWGWHHPQHGWHRGWR